MHKNVRRHVHTECSDNIARFFYLHGSYVSDAASNKDESEHCMIKRYVSSYERICVWSVRILYKRTVNTNPASACKQNILDISRVY